MSTNTPHLLIAKVAGFYVVRPQRPSVLPSRRPSFFFFLSFHGTAGKRPCADLRISDWCQPYVIEAECHTDRTALNNLPSKESRFSRGARGPGGARRPDFKFGTVWENTPGNRHIHIYTKVGLRGAWNVGTVGRTKLLAVVFWFA